MRVDGSNDGRRWNKMTAKIKTKTKKNKRVKCNKKVVGELKSFYVHSWWNCRPLSNDDSPATGGPVGRRKENFLLIAHHNNIIIIIFFSADSAAWDIIRSFLLVPTSMFIILLFLFIFRIQLSFIDLRGEGYWVRQQTINSATAESLLLLFSSIRILRDSFISYLRIRNIWQKKLGKKKNGLRYN
jgi:hypothetical protein